MTGATSTSEPTQPAPCDRGAGCHASYLVRGWSSWVAFRFAQDDPEHQLFVCRRHVLAAVTDIESASRLPRPFVLIRNIEGVQL